jgi:lipopolysaccharide export system permease protein
MGLRATVAALALFAAGPVIASENAPTALWDWDDYLDALKPLGDKVLAITQNPNNPQDRQDTWRALMANVAQTTFDQNNTRVSFRDFVQWQSVLEPGLLNVLLVKPEKMSALSLYSYSQHLKENRQKALRYEIALWTKLLYPVAVLVMMVLALPFAYFQGRQGGVGAKIFAGIMIGLAFHFLNRLLGHLGLLNDWPPFASAVAPTLLFLGLALGMMWWQERR